MPTQRDPSTTEYAVLGILAEAPSHGFAIARHFRPDGDLGRVLTVRRPLVYRALDRLVEAGYAEPASTEPGDSGPQRVVLRATPAGRRRVRAWLGAPVVHVRDLRIEFLVKLTLLRRSGRSTERLVARQREALEGTFAALDGPDPDDHVDLWRRHTAAGAASFLEALGRRGPGG
ncbi:MAG: PadR family transcriptional regulator [Actinobacteria bacterium]|nr:PadR family transcriptional regulator [Actinomycetota bacterium]